jgi:hypothetical protein
LLVWVIFVHHKYNNTYRVKNMADENQELQRQMEELRSSFQGLDAATKNANVGLGAFNKELKTVPGQLVKGLGGLASSVAKGDTSLKSMNAVVDVAANAISGLAKTVPIFGEAMSAATKAIAEGAKIVVDQLDATAKTFNAMSATGALVADGMTGLSRQFTTAGLNLQQFQKVVGQNSVALARFRGMAGEGAEDFSKAVGALTQGQDTSLRKLGMGAEDIADTSAAFVTQQTRLGRSQAMTQDQLTAGSKQYAMELDLLSKVTGMSREAIQKQQDAALSESKFRANYELMMANGQEKQAKALMTLQTRMSSFGAELGQGVRDLSAGVANTEASQKLVNSTGGAALDIMARVKSGAIDQDQAQTEIIEAMERHKHAQLQIASQIGNTAGVFIETSQMQDAINAKNKGAYEKAKTTQDAQINKTDDLTNSTTKAQQNLEKMNIEFSKLAITLLPTAALAIESMTGAMVKFVNYANEKFGGGTAPAPTTAAPAGVSGEFGGEGGGAGGAPGADASVGAVASDAEIAAAKKSVAAGGAAPAGPDSAKSRGPLKLKSAEATAGGASSEKLMDLAYSIQEKLGGDLKYFSGLNDTGRDANSKHKSGQALDLVLNDPERYPGVLGMIKAMPGIKFAQYEQKGQRNPNGSIATGDHIHAEVSAAKGAILSGPRGGYQPNLTMHGTEAVVPLDSPQAQSMGIGVDNSGLMTAQLEKLEEMVSVMKNQLAVSTKIMQYAS